MTPSQSIDVTANGIAAPSAIDASGGSNEPFHWKRIDTATACEAFTAANSFSQRQFAEQHNIPRSTLGYWLRRPAPEDVDPAVTAFLRSPSGEAFLRRLLLALFLVFYFRSISGLRALGAFLCLTGLDRFVAASYGALHSYAAAIETAILSFAQQERATLCKDATKRCIAACLDENFHRRPHPYLVAIEPISGFILLEQHAPCRDGQTWTTVVQAACADLPVDIALICSDQAKGLIACAGAGLAVPHNPDLMHVQQLILQPILLPLQRHIDKAHKYLEQQQQLLEYWQKEKETAQTQQRGPGRPLDYDLRIDFASSMIEHAEQKVQQCERRLQQASEAIRELADLAHPFDPGTGKPVQDKQVAKKLDRTLTSLEQIVSDADLGDKAEKGVGKGFEWVKTLAAVVAWFWVKVRQRVQLLELEEEAEKVVYEELLPGLYWQQQARSGRDAQQRKERRALSERLLKQAWQPGGALSRLRREQRLEVNRVAKELAGLFVRSSSCVEGRNGRLALLQHGHVHLGEQRLKAHTAIHNYLLKREDGTTAAERFFGKSHRDMVSYLLDRLPDLPRPAAKRPKKAADAPSCLG
jgi:hypothetical protein